jgi:alpha-L-fucosidase
MDAKFGIFIHWGVYSVPAWRKLEPGLYASYAEWYYARVMDNKENGGYEFHRENYGEEFGYRDFAPMFRAELFDPVLWADIFKESGAQYVVLTSKHHDGFCLWDTDNVHKKNWNSLDIGPRRDLLGDLREAVLAKGLRMGFYYSIPDWESIPREIDGSEWYINKKYVDKYGLEPEAYVKEVLQPQLKELVLKYEPSIIFADAGEWRYDSDFWGTLDFLAWLYNDSPVSDEVAVNDRWCKGMPGHHGDFYSSEYKDAEGKISNKYWEESRGIGGSYGFNRAENLDDYSSSGELIIELIDIVSRGGNLLLNVGPTADGRIPVIMQQRLRDIGNWLEVNGEAIYGTRKYREPKKTIDGVDVYFTQKPNALYAIMNGWPPKEFRLPVEDPRNVKRVTILGQNLLSWKTEGDHLVLDIPRLTIDQLPCMHAWVLKIEFSE